MMKKTLNQYIVYALTLLSVAYFVATFVLPETQILLWVTAFLICFNFLFSLIELFRQGTITLSLLLLNVIQLVLFGLLCLLIHDILGEHHFSYDFQITWPDWVILIAMHILRALDVVDFIGDYEIETISLMGSTFNLNYYLNISHESTLVGAVLVSMHLMVDVFLLGAIFIAVSNRAAEQKNSSLKKFMDWFGKKLEQLIQLRLWALGGAVGIIVIVAISDGWALSNWFLWPLENILRTLDIGDAFEIFGWENELHSVDMKHEDGRYKWGLVLLGASFRLLIGAYVLGIANRLYLNLLKGRGKTLDELAEICKSPDYSEGEQRLAVEALVKFGSSAVHPLMTALDANQSSTTCRAIIEALGEIGSAAVPAIPSLVKALVDTNNSVRWAAAIALDERIDQQWSQNEGVNDVIPYIIKALTENESQIRYAAADTLGKIGPTAVSAVPELVKNLVDFEKEVRQVTASALKKIDPQWWQITDARSAISHLNKAVDNYNDANRCAYAAVNLEKLDPQWLSSNSARDAIYCLVKALSESENLEMGKAINTTLDKIDAQWTESEGTLRAIPYLVKAMVDSNESVRKVAKDALRKIDPMADKTIPSLVKGRTGTNQDNRQVATEAFEVLNKIYSKWPQNKTALLSIPYLVAALVNSDKDIRNGADEILTKIDPFWARRKIARRAIPSLVKALAMDDSDISCAAAEVLGNMKQAETVPDLVKVQNETGDKRLRWEIENALKKIDPGGHLQSQSLDAKK